MINEPAPLVRQVRIANKSLRLRCGGERTEHIKIRPADKNRIGTKHGGKMQLLEPAENNSINRGVRSRDRSTFKNIRGQLAGRCSGGDRQPNHS